MNTLLTRLLFSFLIVIIMLGVISGLFGYNFIKCNVIKRAQNQVQNDLKAAHAVYDGEIEQMRSSFDLVSSIDNPARLKSRLGLDYLFVIEREQEDSARSAIVRAAFKGNGGGGTRIIDSMELLNMGENLFRRACIGIQPTQRARPTALTQLTSAMAMEYAVPFFGPSGRVQRVLYGGKIINQYFGIVDKIHDIVYENKLYRSKPVGTVTIFQDDVRIATNVLTDAGQRAIGTRVSAEVYQNVVEKGRTWLDRAFVVNDWYLTAYEPIRDVRGSIIGILYVGILKRPFDDMIRSTLKAYLGILGIAAVFAGIIAFFLAQGIVRPITRFVLAAGNLAAGDLTHRVRIGPSNSELTRLADSFNEMAEKLHEREWSLKRTNEQLGVLNARYLDLVGMVTHELKGILSSVMLNACSVRDGYLGEVNDRQKKAMASVVRNLEYFDVTVKNFLSLSRIEKNEFALVCRPVAFKDEIVDASLEAFSRQAQEKHMTLENHVPEGCVLSADPSLLLMVMNNLIGNAVKYGEDGGVITIRMHAAPGASTIEVFNTGRGLSDAEVGRLFKRFSRLENHEGRKVRGTGLGLFLCKETVERHGGTLWCEPRENGNAFIFTLPGMLCETMEKEQCIKENNRG